MSYVSTYKTPLLTELIINPRFELMERCLAKVYSTYHNKMKADPEAKRKLIYDSDFFDDEFAELHDLVDGDRKEQEQFKKALDRAMSCQLQSFSLRTPVAGNKHCSVCRDRGCQNCAKHQATIRLNYHDIIIRYAMFGNVEDGLELLPEIKNLFAEKYPWLTVTLTPFWDGRAMMRIGNLMGAYENPLIDDGFEIRQSILEFDKIYGFDTVTKIPSKGIEVTYMTSGGITFTNTQLYQMRVAGKKGDGIREFGTRRGYEFNAETERIEHYTLEQKKQKKRDEAGIIKQVNMPGVSLEKVPHDIAKNTLKKVGHQFSLDRKQFVLPHEDVEGMKVVTVKMMNMWKDELEYAGYSQVEHFNNVGLTKEDYDNFSKHTIMPVEIPDNILEIEYVNPVNTTGNLSYMVQRQRTMALISAQRHLREVAPTIEEWANDLLKKVYDTLE